MRVTLKRPPLAIFDPATMPSNYFRLRLSPELSLARAHWRNSTAKHARRAVELIARHNTQADKSP